MDLNNAERTPIIIREEDIKAVIALASVLNLQAELGDQYDFSRAVVALDRYCTLHAQRAERAEQALLKINKAVEIADTVYVERGQRLSTALKSIDAALDSIYDALKAWRENK